MLTTHSPKSQEDKDLLPYLEAYTDGREDGIALHFLSRLVPASYIPSDKENTNTLNAEQVTEQPQKKKRKITKKRASAIESREAFFILVPVCIFHFMYIELYIPVVLTNDFFFFYILQTVAQIDGILNQQKRTHLAAGTTFQPVAVFVGTLNNIQDSYVIVDNLKFRLNSPIDALDLVLKIFFVLDCKYPDAAQYVWRLIETIGFDLPHVKTEKLPVSFTTLVNDFKNTTYH